jgi:hypothetical protein
MAIIAATGNGNWSSSGVWTSGLIPGINDIAVINNRSITQDINILCGSIRFDGATYGYTNAGNLSTNASYSFNVLELVGGGLNGTSSFNLYVANNHVINISNLAGGTFGAGPNSTVGGLNIVINCYNLYGGSSAVVRNTSTSGNITINCSGIILGGALNQSYDTGHIINVSTGSININAKRIMNTNAFGGTTTPTIINSSAGTITISGILSSAENTASSAVVVNNAGGTVNVLGETYPLIASCVQNVSSGVINFQGTVRGSRGAANTAYGILNSANGIVNITGVVNGLVVGAAGNTGGNGVYNAGAGIINVVGDVIMEAGGVNATNAGIYNAGVGTVNISGTVTGSTANAAPGVHNASTGSVIVSGIAYAGKVGPAVRNASTGYVYVKRAVGNDYGAGSVGVSYAVGLQNDLTGPCYVEEFQFGNRGSFPLYGPITLQDKTSNVAVVTLSTGASKTLADPTATSGVFPSGYDVRSGVVYNSGSLSGTMVVPNVNSVSYGVAVDSGVGTAVLGGADFWNYLSSSIATSGSIGNRLKNCSTVETAGKQLENSLS